MERETLDIKIGVLNWINFLNLAGVVKRTLKELLQSSEGRFDVAQLVAVTKKNKATPGLSPYTDCSLSVSITHDISVRAKKMGRVSMNCSYYLSFLSLFIKML